MLRHVFDPHKPYDFVRYGRMSTDKQNPRSPDQQFDSIDQVRRRQGTPWVHLCDYRDNARSGRYMKRRPGFQAMLRDIRTGTIKPALILVDTLERLGRNDEIPALRQELHLKYRVLVLTADSGFADPLSVPGRALGFVESIRAVEDGRVKAHNVLRGKKDLILHKKGWPGGRVPLGYRLHSIMKTAASGSTEVDYNQLVRAADSDWIVARIFAKALAEGWGQTRLARYFNADPTIPDQFKPFSPWTVGYMLDNPLYKGELLWNENATGIVNDTRVLQANPEEEWVRVPDFCEPIVAVAEWDSVQAQREKWRQQITGHRQRSADDDKQITPVAPGLAADGGIGLLVALCVAQVGSLFAADAWNNVTFTAGEVKEPRRNIPLSLAVGTGLVIALYFLANLAYLVTLPIAEIQAAPVDRVATATLQAIFPGRGAAMMAMAIMVSTFGCANGLILAGARAAYAMARDGLFFAAASRLNAARVPAGALAFQGLWSCLLVLPRTVDPATGGYGNLYSNLLDYVISAALLFYILTIVGLFRLRRTRPAAERPYRAVGYPWLPALYVAGAALLLVVLAAVPYIVAALVFFGFWSKPDWRYLVGVFVFVPMLIVEGVFGSLDLVRAFGRRRRDVAQLVAITIGGIVAVATGLSAPGVGSVLPKLSLMVTIAFVAGIGIAVPGGVPAPR